MGEGVKVVHSILHVEIRHLARFDCIRQRHIRVYFHALLTVEAHLFVHRMAFVPIARPFHGLHVGREFDHLRCQRAVEHPSSSYRDLRRTALTAGKIDFDSDIAGLNPRDRNQETGNKPESNQQQRGHEQKSQDPARSIVTSHTPEKIFPVLLSSPSWNIVLIVSSRSCATQLARTKSRRSRA